MHKLTFTVKHHSKCIGKSVLVPLMAYENKLFTEAVSTPPQFWVYQPCVCWWLGHQTSHGESCLGAGRGGDDSDAAFALGILEGDISGFKGAGFSVPPGVLQDLKPWFIRGVSLFGSYHPWKLTAGPNLEPPWLWGSTFSFCRVYLEDHPRTCRWLGSPPFTRHLAHLEELPQPDP